jgi:hypothetical protein
MLDSESVEHLHTFWLTTQALVRNMGVELNYGEPDFRHFGHWVAARAGDGLNNGGWSHFLKDRDDSYSEFFRLLSEFRQQRLQVFGRMEFGQPHPVPWTTQLKVDDRWTQVPQQYLRAVALGNYGPEQSCFVVLEYLSGEVEHRWVWTESRALEFLRVTLDYTGPTEWGALIRVGD